MYTQAQFEQHDGRPVEDHIVHFGDVGWEDYERLLAMRAYREALRDR